MARFLLLNCCLTLNQTQLQQATIAGREKMMKRILSYTALALSLMLTTGAPGALAKKTKPSPEHAAAVRKCNEDYRTALKEAKGKKGKERREAEGAARQARMQCRAAAK